MLKGLYQNILARCIKSLQRMSQVIKSLKSQHMKPHFWSTPYPNFQVSSLL